MRVAVYNIDQVWAYVSVTAKGRLRGHAHRAIRGGNFLKHHCGDRLREGRLLARLWTCRKVRYPVAMGW